MNDDKNSSVDVIEDEITNPIKSEILQQRDADLIIQNTETLHSQSNNEGFDLKNTEQINAGLADNNKDPVEILEADHMPKLIHEMLNPVDTMNDCNSSITDSSSERSRSHSVESIITAKSFARNIPGLVGHNLSVQEKSLIKCITSRILDEVMPKPGALCLLYKHDVELVVPGLADNSSTNKRYLVLMTGSLLVDPDIKEHAILGINIVNNGSEHSTVCANHDMCKSSCQGDIVIAMVLPVTQGMSIEMNGDGGIIIKPYCRAHRREYVFKPINLQALWVSHSYLMKDIENAEVLLICPGSKRHHSWTGWYSLQIPPLVEIDDDWEDNSQIEHQVSPDYEFMKNPQVKRLMDKVLMRMKEIVMGCDPDTADCLSIRRQLEHEFGTDFTAYKRFLNEQIVRVFGQTNDPPSKIFDYLYLGNEWNASNLPQLQAYGITHILNVTMEIANFFKDKLQYYTIRIHDRETANLQKHWDSTYSFIKSAKKQDKKVFVHCRMGISRSASCVIAYIMKEYKMSFSVAMNFVKKIRTCIKPNPGFSKQLEEYNGILEARHNDEWGSKAVKRARRCAQLSDQMRLTERWLKERELYDKVEEVMGSGDDKETTEAPTDNYQKVVEWLTRNGSGFEEDLPNEVTSPVIAADLLCELNTGGCDTPIIYSENVSELDLPVFDDQDVDSAKESDDINVVENELKSSNTVTKDSVSPGPQVLDQLSADGPFSQTPDKLENEVALATRQLSDCDRDSLEEKVVRKLKSNPSIRRTDGKASKVRKQVVKLEVESERHKQTDPRNRTRSENGANAKRKKIRQVQSWAADYSTEPVVQPSTEAVKPTKKNKKEHNKTWTGSRRHKICTSIKKIIERLLSPREKQGTKHCVTQEIADIAIREGKPYVKENRMSAPTLDSMDLSSVLPKRRCHSQIFPHCSDPSVT